MNMSGCMANTQDTLRHAFKNVSDVEMSLMISGLPIGGLFGGLLAGLIAGMWDKLYIFGIGTNCIFFSDFSILIDCICIFLSYPSL